MSSRFDHSFSVVRLTVKDAIAFTQNKKAQHFGCAFEFLRSILPS